MGQESSHELVGEDMPARTLKDRTIGSVAEYVQSGKAKRVVVLTGAGISTSAGIPDFRSPDTGLYSNLARLDLPYPEAVFDISFFRQNPQPFYMLAHELYPGKFKPTVGHVFIALLARKGLLHMLFTQNIDCLERAAGVPPEKVIEAHGSFATQRCIDCKTEYPDKLMEEIIMLGDEVPHCQECDGIVKPDITFFGESLPERFHSNTHVPAEADLMIIIGTSLSVHPFASLPQLASPGIPRVLINFEMVGGLGSRADDVLLLGDCDEQVRKLADELGWREELEALYRDVGGPAALVEPATPRTKHEALEDEIEKLTTEVDHALKISNGHKNWLEKHLAHKSATGAPVEVDSSVYVKGIEAQKIETAPSELQIRLSRKDEFAEGDLVNNDAQTHAPAAELNLDTAQKEPLGDEDIKNNSSKSNTPVQSTEATIATSLAVPQRDRGHATSPRSEPNT